MRNKTFSDWRWSARWTVWEDGGQFWEKVHLSMPWLSKITQKRLTHCPEKPLEMYSGCIHLKLIWVIWRRCMWNRSVKGTLYVHCTVRSKRIHHPRFRNCCSKYREWYRMVSLKQTQWLQKGPDFGTWSRSGPMSKNSPEKGPICLSSPEVHKCDFELCTDATVCILFLRGRHHQLQYSICTVNLWKKYVKT